MSTASAQLFIERMKTDHAFAQGVTNCKNAQEREALVREAGFDFTGEEVRQCATELTDEDLEGVSGGKYNPEPAPCSIWEPKDFGTGPGNR